MTDGPLITAILIGSIGVLAIDYFGALASRRLGFPYASLLVLSTAVYALSGWIVLRGGTAHLAPLAGGIVGFVDSTVGWRISWMIGPGRMDAKSTSARVIVITVLFVSLLAAGVAAASAYVFEGILNASQ